MNISLIAINSRFSHSNLAVRYLQKEFADSDLQSKYADISPNLIVKEFTINNRLEDILYEIVGDEPRIIYFSVYIWNVEIVYNLIQNIRKILKEVKICVGGPEVSYSPGYVLSADCVLRGDGEKIFIRSIEDFLQNKLKENYGDNLSHEEWKFPYSDLTSLSNKKIYYETSRGCPYNCAYCLSSSKNGVIFAPLDRVKEELDFFLKAAPMQVKFVDRSFNANRDRAYEIFKYLIDNDNGKTNFHFEMVASLIDEKTIDLLKNAREGLFQFEIGIQTTNPLVQKAINRGLQFEKFRGIIETLISLGNIHIHLDLIAGLPGEDMASFKKSFNDVYSLKADDLQLGFLKLLKGTNLYNFRDMYCYEYNHQPPYEILSSKEMSYFDLRTLKHIENVLELYSNSGKFKHSLSIIDSRGLDPFDFFLGLGNHFVNKNLYGNGIKFERLFDEFYDYISDEEVYELLKIDFEKSRHSAFPQIFKTSVKSKNLKR